MILINIQKSFSYNRGPIHPVKIPFRLSYYFSNTHDQKSEAYTLFNSSLEYTNGSFSATIWVRNLADEEYAVRGFYWGNNPTPTPGYPDGYEDELYVQKGTPRTFGLTVAYDF